MPSAHKTVVALVDPTGHAYPAAQSKHDPAPGPLNLPAGQGVAVGVVLPGGHAYPAVQLPLQASKGMLKAAPYLPPGHRLQRAGVAM